MLIDNLLRVSDATALTATAVSSTYDQGAPFTSGGVNTEIGEGEPMGFGIKVGVAADHTTGDETYEIDIISATAADGTTGQVIHQQFVLLYSQLTAGATFVLPISPGLITQRYLGLKYVLGGTTPTVTITADLAPLSMLESRKKYYSTASTTAA